MLTDKVKREINARLASVVNENETFTKYLLAEDDEYIEKKLDPEYELWYKLAQIQYQVELNARDAFVMHESLRRITDPFKRKDLEAEQRKLKWDMIYLYAEAVHYLKEYDWDYSSDGEHSANGWDWDFLKDKSFSDAPLWQFDA